MLTSLLPATAVILVILAALTACTTASPAPSPAATLAPRSDAATPALPPNTPEPESTPTSPREPTTVIPTAARASTPTITPSPQATVASGPTPTPGHPRALAPLEIQDAQGLRSALSRAELDCVGDAEGLARTLAGPGVASRDEQAELIGCLEDETVARLFLAGFVPGTEPLSLESSACVRAAFEVIDPRTVTTAGLEGDPGRAMAGSMTALLVTTACLNDEEWATAGPEMGMGPEDRVEGQCLMEALGGPGEMAAAMIAAQEGDFAALAGAGEECGLDMGPPGQAPTGPSQAPTTVPLPTQVNQAPSQAQDIPALTDDQVTKMKESISGDPILTVMLQGGYTINDYGPWVAGDRAFIGAIAEIFLTALTDYQGSLPMVGFEPAEDASKEYISETLNITASGIKSLIILVDLAEEEVVGIEIGESDTLTFSAEGE